MELSITNEVNPDEKSYVVNQLIRFNSKHFPDEWRDKYEVIHLLLKDEEQKLYGGLVGAVCLNWLEVQYLFVEDAVRKNGYGKKLLAAAEQIARDRECEFMKLDTFSFQALSFYLQQGFEVYGTLPNAGGHTHYYLKKDLVPVKLT
ncbi:GNAT family N-acetyltransferase [Paenibacillus sp. CC-CFT747]|nr:GNAT family N-acetyltransferase [Paenibacillus sp. CC-CFT747]